MNFSKKRFFAALGGLALVATLSVFGQETSPTDSTNVLPGKASVAARQCLNDQDGDGVCDRCGRTAGSGRQSSPGARAGRGQRFGPGDGTGNRGSGPRDGTGFGSKAGRSDPSTCPGNRGGGRGHRGGRG